MSAGIFAALLLAFHASTDSVTALTSLDSIRLLQQDTGVLFIDARPGTVYRRGHIPRAVSLPEEDFDSLITGFAARTPAERPLVVYCDGSECRASDEVAARLREKGYRRILRFFGGWNVWRDAGLATERSAP